MSRQKKNTEAESWEDFASTTLHLPAAAEGNSVELPYKAGGNLDFDGKDAYFTRLSHPKEAFGERKWITMFKPTFPGLRVTRNTQSEDWRIIVTLTPDRLQGMNLRHAADLSAAFDAVLEKIINRVKKEK